MPNLALSRWAPFIPYRYPVHISPANLCARAARCGVLFWTTCVRESILILIVDSRQSGGVCSCLVLWCREGNSCGIGVTATGGLGGRESMSGT